MPGGDRTGPAGMGPLTGRAAGTCAGYPVPGFMNTTMGRGFGGGRGWGRGGGGGGGWRHRHWFYATGMSGWQRGMMGWPAAFPAAAGPFVPAMTRGQELDALKQQARHFEQALDDLRKRIVELESPEECAKTT
jgi:hypothetical protein